MMRDRPIRWRAALRIAAFASMVVATSTLAVVACAPAAASRAAAANPSLPTRIGDDQFWRFVADFSEPGGFFRSDNFLSNENSYQQVIPTLQRRFGAGGVYLGVGPEQNFTYIVALRPKISFIFDIRRQNLVQHLYYKALFEMSPTRADFLANLFSRPRPKGLDTTTSVESLFVAYQNVAPDTLLFRRTYRDAFDRLTKTHGFRLTSEDSQSFSYVTQAFFEAGPELNYSFRPGRPPMMRGRMPSYSELMVETDSAGTRRSYLATEENYRTIKSLEDNNLVIPLVGDFAGPKAIRAVGDYLRARSATVSAFYTSNVEQYLFRQGDDWNKFFANVGTLPTDTSSVFIRSVFGGGSGMVVFVRPANPTQQGNLSGYGMRSGTVLSGIANTVQAVTEGRVQSYNDVIQMSQP